MSEISRLAIQHKLTRKEAEELYALIQDARNQNFTYSNELSRYITDNNLGETYPHISGIVRMKDTKQEWDYDGGFSKRTYAIICSELNLKNKNTSAQAIGFTPYGEK